MNSATCNIDQKDVHKLLSAASGDAALLYLYLQSGNELDSAEASLHMSQSRVQCAAATLRQLGVWQEEKLPRMVVGERPRYTEKDVTDAKMQDMSFRALCDEVERNIGRVMTTEELKILLGFVRYLGFSTDVIFVLICYCRERAKQKGGQRNPSLRSIEKEAYAWAEQGIDTVEEASAYIQNQNMRASRIGKLMQIFHIRGRSLTQAEERYAQQWIDMGFADDAFSLAYERTCLNTGSMNWAYMNKILTRWHQAGITNAEQAKNKDKKPVPKGASGQMGQAELDAIQRILKQRGAESR